MPAPDAPTRATVSPGMTSRLTPSSTSRSGSCSGVRCSSEAIAVSAAGGYRNRTASKVTRPAGATRSTAPGRSLIASGASSTSKTRSKLTIDVIRSTRALVSPVRGWYTRVTRAASATSVPTLISSDTTRWAPTP